MSNDPRDYYVDVPFVLDEAPLKEQHLILALGVALHQLTTPHRCNNSWEDTARREALRTPLRNSEAA